MKTHTDDLHRENRLLVGQMRSLCDRLDLLEEAIRSAGGMIWEKWLYKDGTIRYCELLQSRVIRLIDNQEEFNAAIHPDDRERVVRVNREVWSGERNGYFMEFRLEVSGKYHYLREYVQAQSEEGGLRVMGYTWDLTDLDELQRRHRAEKEFLDAVLDNAGSIIVLTDREGRIRYMNQASLAAYGYSPEERHQLIGREFIRIMPWVPGISEQIRRVYEDICRGEMPPRGCRAVHVTRDGTPFDVQWTNTMIEDENGQEIVISIGKDITSMIQAHEAIQRREERYRTALEGTQDCVIDYWFDEDRVILSRQWTRRFFGSDDETVDGFRNRFSGIVPAERKERVHQAVEAMQSGRLDRLDREMPLQDRSGTVVWIRIKGRVFLEDTGRRFLGLATDITELVLAREKIEHMAYHDHLTSMKNSRHFKLQAPQILGDAGGGHLLFVDIDDFKGLNDRYGHHAGDQVLQVFAKRLQGLFREEDLLCRLGGDEFLALVAGVGDRDIELIVSRLKQRCGEPYLINGNEIFLTLSIGVSVCRDGGTSLDQLISMADQAMYRVKDGGKNGYHWATLQE